MFIEKFKVHPLVDYIKKEYRVTWAELGKILSDRMKSYGVQVNLSPSNVRNFATSRSHAWWFWREISGIVIGLWKQEKKGAIDLIESKNIDLKFSELFSEDLKVVYLLWYEILETSVEKSSQCLALKSSLTLTNSIVNSHEEFFSCEYPRIPEIDSFYTKLINVS